MIFEMRNIVIVSRGRGGVGGLEKAEASRDREQEKENSYEGGNTCLCNRINELPEFFEVKVYLHFSSHLYIYIYIYIYILCYPLPHL